MLGDLTTTTEDIDTQQLSQALDVVSGTLDDAAPEIETAFDGIARLSRSVASRDEQIQSLLDSSSEVTQVLEARSDDIVDLMRNSDLVFQELQKRKHAVHTLLVNARSLADELKGVATDNQEQIGPALQEVDDLLSLLVDRRDQLKATLHQLGPYVEILSNIIGTGPWFDAMAINLATLPVELRPDVPEFVGGVRRMITFLKGLERRVVLLVVVLLGLTAILTVAVTPGDTKTVTAHFPRAVSIYDGTEVRILGVRVGEVTAVIPEGNSVRVEMEYDANYDVPEDAQAVIVTPTLVADRFVQLTPVYEGGPAMADGAEIELPDTGVPVELDRIYGSLQTLTQALGPNGVNADGTLDNFLKAGRNAFEGQGARGNEMLRELSAAVETFGEGAGRCSRP